MSNPRSSHSFVVAASTFLISSSSAITFLTRLMFFFFCSSTSRKPSTSSCSSVISSSVVSTVVSLISLICWNLRWIMLECLHAYIRNEKNSNIAQFYHRISKKKGNSKAAVPAPSKLLKIVYWIMKEKRLYERIV